MSVLRTIVESSRALVTGAKDISRLREIAAVFWKHGFGSVVRALRIRRELALEGDVGDASESPKDGLVAPDLGKRLVAAFTELGPTWVKFGQILSTRPDFVPKAVCDELSKLQDTVEPIPWEDVKSLLERNLGSDYANKFAHFEEKPLASASIGQVHRARLADGTEVVVKVQRPGIRPKIESDLHILSTIAGYIEEAFDEAQAMDIVGTVGDFAKSLEQELDYRSELANMERFRSDFKNSSFVVIPKTYKELCTSEVLVMEFMRGKKFGDVLAEGRDMDPLVKAYFDMAYTMLFVNGFFHGDLHPGNVFVMEGDKLAVIDCGMVGRLPQSRKDKVVDIVWAIINNDFEGVARTLFQLAIPRGPVDYAAFEAHAVAVAERYLSGVSMAQIELGKLFGELVRGATMFNLRMPTDFTMMFKAMVTTEGLAKSIAPDVDPIEIARPYLAQMITDRYSPDRLRQAALTDLQMLSTMLRQMPRSIPMLLDTINKGDLSVGINERSIDKLARATEIRTGRTIRAAFTIALMMCGTATLAIPGLSIAFAGIPWVTFVFWTFAAIGAVRLFHRGGLL